MGKQNKKDEKKEPQKKKKAAFFKKGWWRNPKLISGAGIIILSVIFFFVSFFWAPGEVYYRIKETFTFTFTEAGSLELAVLLPSSGSNQEVFDPEVEWPGTWEIREEGRLRVLRLEASVQADETIRAVIIYRANLSQDASRWMDETVNATDTDASLVIQSDAPEIIAQAELLQIAGDEVGTLRNIYGFTQTYLPISDELADDDDESALTVLREASGGEIGRANLLSALSRASGLPARTVSGQRLPTTIPFIPVTGLGQFPGQNSAWNEVFYESAWGQVDPNTVNGFYKPATFGWTDARHLVYAETEQIDQVLQSLLLNAEESDQWRSSSTQSLRYAAWADVEQDRVESAIKVSVMTTWDARWVMFVALVIIIALMAWLMQEKLQKNYSSSRRKK